MEVHSKLKIGSREAHDTGDPLPHVEFRRSKVKVTRLINAETENVPCLRNGKAYEHAMTENQPYSECEGLRTSNFVNGWSTTTRITHMHGDLKGQRSRL